MLLILSPAWSGDPAQGQAAIDRFLRLGSPVLTQLKPSTYADTPGPYDACITRGRHYAISIHHFHGAASRVPIQATAFGIRRKHFVVEIVADALLPRALPGGYANILGPHAYDQIARAHGPNVARLRAAKARFDSAGRFSAIPLPVITEE